MSRKKKKKQEIDSKQFRVLQICKNCGHKNKGKYCSKCGQSFVNFNRPLKEVFQDFVGIFGLDYSIFRTIGPFLFKPGFLSREYLEGRRKKYLSPVRLYLFLSIIFFFIASKSSVNIIGNNDNFTLNIDSTETKIDRSEELIEAHKADSIFQITELDSSSTNPSTIKRDQKLKEGILKAAENQTLYIRNFLKNISYSLFILMPIFALILQLLYVRRKKYYIEHLIFSINMHSFALLIFAIVFTIRLLFKGDNNFVLLLILVIPVYFVIGMKRYYKQGLFKTLLKTILLGLIYMIPFIASSFGLIYLTMMRM